MFGPGKTTSMAGDQGPHVTGADGRPPGEPRRQGRPVPFTRRASSWLVWWVLLLGLWVAIDDSIGLAELGAGAGAFRGCAAAVSLT